MKNEYGLQLYSVRDAMGENMENAIAKVAEMGYKYVEFAGFYGRSAAEVKKMLDDNGLICSGTHSDISGLLPTNIMETIEYHKTIGNPNYIMPSADVGTLEKIKRFCDIVNYAKPIMAAEGINVGFHNHSGEFQIMPWGSTMHSEMEKGCGVDFEIDTFWAFNAGLDPIQVLERLKNRIHVIHVKDGFMGGKGTALGKGEAPVKAVVEYASKNNIRMVVESESLNPSGLEEAKVCIEYLKSLEA